MKLHRPLLRAIEEGLNKVFVLHQQSEDVVSLLFQSHPEWGSRDRKFIAENIFDIIRFKRLYEYCGALSDENYFQNLIGIRLAISNYSGLELFFPNSSLNTIAENAEAAKNIFKIRESIPDWLDEYGRDELNEKWETEIHALNRPAQFCLRHNPLQCKKSDLTTWLHEEKISFSEIKDSPDTIILDLRKNLRNTKPFKNGWFEIQDASSQNVAPFLRAQHGMKILDACAGAGGKSLHLASIMKNEGEIFSCDVDERKLYELNYRAKRANAKIITTHLINDSFIEENKNKFDRVLSDVPCSGSGTLRRKPDLKWNLSKEKIEEVILIQKNILSNYKIMLKTGGLLVYSTCSIFPSENQKQVDWFLSQNKNFKLKEDKVISPNESGFDGFYMALLEKTKD
jgi:16S rRNA (cytosine967-C5)-methyltransferase